MTAGEWVAKDLEALVLSPEDSEQEEVLAFRARSKF